MKILKFIALLFLIIYIIGYFSELKKQNYKNIKQTKTDSLTYQIKVRDSIIYDLYQENKRLKLQQQNFQ
jgi:hypothetical protein